MRYRSLAPLIVALFIAAGLALWCQGCWDEPFVDQCMRREIFEHCIEEGREHGECMERAYYLSLRRESQIAPRCRP